VALQLRSFSPVPFDFDALVLPVDHQAGTELVP
jgi:hypothetical protein